MFFKDELKVNSLKDCKSRIKKERLFFL